MKNDSFEKKTKSSGNFTRKYTAFLNKALVPGISVSIHLVLLAALSFLVFYTPKPASPKFNIIGMTEIKIPELKNMLKLDDVTQDRKTTGEGSASSAQDSNPSTASEGNATAAGSAGNNPQVIHAEMPKNIFTTEQATGLNNFDGGFLALGDAAASRGIGSENPFAHRRGRGGYGTSGTGANGGSGQGGSGSGSGNSGSGSGGMSKDEKKINEAVLKALEWLRQNQNHDGSWGNGLDPDMRTAISSLAVLAFLANGETTCSPAFGENVKSGLKNLLSKGGSYGSSGFSGSFGEALLTYVLAEGATVTQVPELIMQTRNRATLICRQLSSQGGLWRTSTLTAWNYQALKAAIFAVSCDEFNSAAMDSARSLLSLHREQSGNSLAKKSKSASITELDDIFQRSYCLQLFGYTGHPVVKKYLDQVSQYNKEAVLSCNWSQPPEWPLYSWYYRTNALFFISGGRGHDWQEWYKNLTEVLLTKQDTDGSFISPDAKINRVKSGETAKTFGTENDLTVYSTAMCALTLQAKYRYLPSYCAEPAKQVAGDVFSAPEVEKKIGLPAIYKKFDVQR